MKKRRQSKNTAEKEESQIKGMLKIISEIQKQKTKYKQEVRLKRKQNVGKMRTRSE